MKDKLQKAKSSKILRTIIIAVVIIIPLLYSFFYYFAYAIIFFVPIPKARYFCLQSSIAVCQSSRIALLAAGKSSSPTYWRAYFPHPPCPDWPPIPWAEKNNQPFGTVSTKGKKEKST